MAPSAPRSIGSVLSLRARRRLAASAAGLDVLTLPQRKGLVVFSRCVARLHPSGRITLVGSFERIHAATAQALQRLGFVTIETDSERFREVDRVIRLTLVGVTAAAMLLDTGDVE